MRSALRGLLLFRGKRSSSLLNGLVSYWALEEASGTRFDSASTNNLTSNNSVAQAVGKIGNCASFTAASSQFLSLGTVLLTGGPFTLSAWVNRASTGTTQAILTQCTAGGTKLAFDLSNSGTVRLTLNQSIYVATSVGVGTNTWHMATVTWDGTSLMAYLDAANATAPVAQAFVTGAITLHLGSYNNSSFFNGLMDEVGVWNRVLTGNEISTGLYNNGNGKTYPFLGA